MFKRTRDKVPLTRKKTIDPLVWKEVCDRFDCADAILNGKKFKPFFDLLIQSKQYATDVIVQNRILDTKEVHTISDTLKKVFYTPKKVQQDELVGQIKFVQELEDTLNQWIEDKRVREDLINKGELEIETERMD